MPGIEIEADDWKMDLLSADPLISQSQREVAIGDAQGIIGDKEDTS